MAENNKGGTAVLAIAIGIAAAVAYFMSNRDETPPPPDEETVPAGSVYFSTPPPAQMDAGSSYNTTVAITNSTKTDSTPTAYTFKARITVSVAGASIYDNTKSVNLAAGATGSASWSFAIPSNKTGNGTAVIQLLSQEGEVLDSYTYTFTVAGTEPPPEQTTVRQQLANVWNQISCGGSSDSTKGIWTNRNGAWQMFCAADGVDEIGYFVSGEAVWLYNTGTSVTLTYGGHSWQLVSGWNTIGWL